MNFEILRLESSLIPRVHFVLRNTDRKTSFSNIIPCSIFSTHFLTNAPSTLVTILRSIVKKEYLSKKGLTRLIAFDGKTKSQRYLLMSLCMMSHDEKLNRFIIVILDRVPFEILIQTWCFSGPLIKNPRKHHKVTYSRRFISLSVYYIKGLLDPFLVSLLLTLNRLHTLFWCFHC